MHVGETKHLSGSFGELQLFFFIIISEMPLSAELELHWLKVLAVTLLR